MGDTMCYHVIREQMTAPLPLLSVDGAWSGGVDEIGGIEIRRTRADDAVLSGVDRGTPEGIDRWVGGVPVNGSAPRWRWKPDEAGYALRRASRTACRMLGTS